MPAGASLPQFRATRPDFAMISGHFRVIFRNGPSFERRACHARELRSRSHRAYRYLLSFEQRRCLDSCQGRGKGGRNSGVGRPNVGQVRPTSGVMPTHLRYTSTMRVGSAASNVGVGGFDHSVAKSRRLYPTSSAQPQVASTNIDQMRITVGQIRATSTMLLGAGLGVVSAKHRS